jgi:SH3-like domain-containing protein
MRAVLLSVLIGLLSAGASPPVRAAQPESIPAFRGSGLPVPRFVSLRSDHIYARSGPGMRYPIKWVFQKESLPVEVVQEFDTWRKIKDKDGESGWVHQSLLSGARSVIVQPADPAAPGPVDMRKSADPGSRLVARVEPGVVADLRQCEDSGPCQITVQGFRGWIDRRFLWGIYPGEKLD